MIDNGMTDVAKGTDSAVAPGLSGAEVANLVELLKKVLNNPTPSDAGFRSNAKGPLALQTPEVDLKGNISDIYDSLSRRAASLSASHPCDQRTVWRELSSEINSACQAFACSRS